jgi:hypothetical protein
MISDRDSWILSSYADGATLEDIGAEVDLTRERVRQIVSKHGGVDAEASRRERSRVREGSRQEARDAILARHLETFRALSNMGLSRQASIQRITTFYPDVDADLADEALRTSGVIFDQEASENLFSDAVLEAGVWYLLASELRLKPDPLWASVNLTLEIASELPLVLAEAGVSPDEIATILGMIGAAQKHVLESPSVTITGNRYQELRTELLDAMGLPSAKGSAPWPPTRQTIIKRFSGWNDALTAIGLATANRGRTKGLVVFTEKEYVDAVIDFLSVSETSGTTPTYAAYGAWALSRREAEDRRPSSAAVRNFYGSWLRAMRVAHQGTEGRNEAILDAKIRDQRTGEARR